MGPVPMSLLPRFYLTSFFRIGRFELYNSFYSIIDLRRENYKNNSEDNLQVLCPNCHSMTPNYKNAGNHKGRFVF